MLHTVGISGSPFRSYSTSAIGAPDTTVKCGNRVVSALPGPQGRRVTTTDAPGVEFNHVHDPTDCQAGRGNGGLDDGGDRRGPVRPDWSRRRNADVSRRGNGSVLAIS